MNDDLFPVGGPTPIPIQDGQLLFIERLPLRLASQEILSLLIAQTAWRAESVTLWGKRYLQPRLVAWHGDADTDYSYSGITLAPVAWSPLLSEIKSAVEEAVHHQFNSVLLNYYRDQHDSIGFHSDDEAELGANPVIASLSFGAARTFVLKHKVDKTRKPLALRLADGNLLLMAGALQKHWLHGINKETKICGPRVNLTFRTIIKPNSI